MVVCRVKEEQSLDIAAIDRDSRKIVGVYAGRRDTEGALGLCNSLPESCMENIMFYTDFW